MSDKLTGADKHILAGFEAWYAIQPQNVGLIVFVQNAYLAGAWRERARPAPAAPDGLAKEAVDSPKAVLGSVTLDHLARMMYDLRVKEGSSANCGLTVREAELLIQQAWDALEPAAAAQEET